MKTINEFKQKLQEELFKATNRDYGVFILYLEKYNIYDITIYNEVTIKFNMHERALLNDKTLQCEVDYIVKDFLKELARIKG